MSAIRTLSLLLVIAFFLLIPLSQSYAQAVFLGTPTVRGMIGEFAAGRAFDLGLEIIRQDRLNSIGLKGYEKALNKYEKKLRKLKKKHAKLRKKEEQTLQRLIDDMASYSREDAARGQANRKQQEKQKKAYEYARKIQNKDRMRVKEIEQLHEKYYPKIESFIRTM